MTNTPDLDKVRAYIQRRESLLQAAYRRVLPTPDYGSESDQPRAKLPPVDAGRRTVVREIRPGCTGFQQIQNRIEPHT